MVTVPAFVWRGGFFRRALITGGAMGIFLGALAWIDSGFLMSGGIVLVIIGIFYGIWMPRRMARHWPGAAQLDGADRVTVVRAARRGEHIGEVRLAQPVIDYAAGLHTAAEKARPFRWLLLFVLVVAVATAVWDAVFGSWGNGVASGIYLVMLLIEVFWWPNRQEQLVTNSERTAAMARAQSSD